MKQERFTEQAQEALNASQQLAMQFKHSQWDVEHVLISLLMQQQGLVGDIIKEIGVDVETVRNQVDELLKKTPQVSHQPGQIFATPRIAAMMNRADAEALRYVGGHILHAVNSEIDAAVQQGLLDFFHKKPLAAHLGKGYIQDLVSSGFYNGQVDGQGRLATAP